MLNHNKNRRYLIDSDEPPEKKLISDGDRLVKKLAEKQQSKTTSLKEQLAYQQEFKKGSEFVPLTSYTAGASTLQNFVNITNQLDEKQRWKALELTDSDIELYLDNKKGLEYIKMKHRNLNEKMLEDRLRRISEVIRKSEEDEERSKPRNNHDRQMMENMLSIKPNSVETKLLKFALDNEKQTKKTLPHPMDEIKQIETDLKNDLAPINMKKIQKKARQIGKQIEILSEPFVPSSPASSLQSTQNNSLATNSKWDSKTVEISQPPIIVEKTPKLYICKPQTLYTIRDGTIVKLNQLPREEIISKTRLSVEEIKNLPKFQNYDPGRPSKVLFLKNLANNLNENDLKNLLEDLRDVCISIKIMKGRMRGQAFIEFPDVETAEKALTLANGKILKNKAVIIQFGKGK